MRKFVLTLSLISGWILNFIRKKFDKKGSGKNLRKTERWKFYIGKSWRKQNERQKLYFPEEHSIILNKIWRWNIERKRERKKIYIYISGKRRKGRGA